jgi:pre-60S factor REI1
MNHKQSKKHKDLEVNFLSTKNIIKQTTGCDDNLESSQSNRSQIVSDDNSKTNLVVDDLIVSKSDRTEKKAIQMNEYLKKQEKLLQQQTEEDDLEIVHVDDEDATDKNWEDIDDEDTEKDEFDDSLGIPINDCLFCDSKFSSVEDKCEHMAKVHSFFVPDMGHVSDLEGLVKFLGIKVGVYHVCLWCSTKCYRDLLSVKRHMSDKGHQKMKFEGETLLEYADFYSFDSDDENEDDEDYEMLNESSYCMGDSEKSLALYGENGSAESSDLNDENYELVLPSGARIGHRSLFKYYKQSFGHRNLEIKKHNNLSLRDKYKAIAANGAYNRNIYIISHFYLNFFKRKYNFFKYFYLQFTLI